MNKFLMTELIPFLSGVVTILFGIGFYFGLQEFKTYGEDHNPEGVDGIEDVDRILDD